MAIKQYLDQAGVERLIRNINLQLSHKVDIEENARTLENYATNSDLAQIAAKLSSVYHFRGSVDTHADLDNIINPEIGDVYNIIEDGMNVGWTGESWDDFGSIADLSPYAKLEDIDAIPMDELTRILFSGSVAVVSNPNEFSTMLTNNESKVDITLDNDITVSSSFVVPVGKTVTLDLGGNKLTATNITPIVVNGGEVILKNGEIESSVTAINVDNGGSIILDGANINSTGNNGVSLHNGSTGTINSGSITSREASVAVFKESTLTINGGILTGIDNGPVMGNGTVGDKPNNGENTHIVMNGGKLIAHIQSAGYVACGVYLPNSGSFTMNGGEIISDGAGIVMRGGTVNLNGGSIKANGTSGVLGKVGDSQITVGPYAVVYEAQSRYPHYETLELNIANGMALEGTDGDISILLGEGIEANIHDNR